MPLVADGYALAMQAAIVAALKADTDLSALVGARVYGRRVPDAAQRPYVWINNIVVRDVRSDCGKAALVTFGVEAVSQDVKAADVEASRCAEAVNAADGKSFEVVSAYSALLDG